MTNIETNGADSDKVALRKRYGKSRITNGSQLLPLADGRSMTARRFRDVFMQIATDLGGIDRLSEGQKQLIRRVSQLSAECERMEAMSARGEQPLDLRAYQLASQCIARLLTNLGITRAMREVDHHPQSLRSYLQTIEANAQDRAGLDEAAE
jgi:hypothetical protein